MSIKKEQLRKQLDCAGTKLWSENLEESIMSLTIFRRLKGLRVSQKLIMKKPIFTYQEITPTESRAESVEFKASREWLEKFMRRDNLTLREKTSLSQKCPDKVIFKL